MVVGDFLPGLSSLVDDKDLTLTLEHSADGESFETLADFAAPVSTGADSAGAAAASSQDKLPSTCERYIRASDDRLSPVHLLVEGQFRMT